MGLADIHQYHPSKDAFGEADLVLMVGGRLDNQMNFGNAPLFPQSTELICINGSHEEVDFNRAADMTLLRYPGAVFNALISLGESALSRRDAGSFSLNRQRRLPRLVVLHADSVTAAA